MVDSGNFESVWLIYGCDVVHSLNNDIVAHEQYSYLANIDFVLKTHIQNFQVHVHTLYMCILVIQKANILYFMSSVYSRLKSINNQLSGA